MFRCPNCGEQQIIYRKRLNKNRLQNNRRKLLDDYLAFQYQECHIETEKQEDIIQTLAVRYVLALINGNNDYSNLLLEIKQAHEIKERHRKVCKMIYEYAKYLAFKQKEVITK